MLFKNEPVATGSLYVCSNDLRVDAKGQAVECKA